MPVPAIAVASANGIRGLDVARDILVGGGSALDAAEAAVRVVEDDPDDHTVGYGGYPNLLGVVELDASIMDGTTRRAGAVGSLRGYKEAITVARAVMERLPHVLVVGDGAARLAADIGLQPTEMLTPEAEAVWRDGIEGRVPEEDVGASMLARVASLVTDPERAAGTVNVLTRDTAGRLASGVSTSGWAWKFPGRLGDTPVIGAGSYADDRSGAAACTGWGELAIRAGTARMVVSALAAGVTPADACRAALEDVLSLDPDSDTAPVMHLLTLGADGRHAAASTSSGRMYAVWEQGMAAAEQRPRLHVTT